MLEMPLAELEQNVQMELDSNPALEASYDDISTVSDAIATLPDGNAEAGENDMARDERERREDALNDALNSIGDDDRMEVSYSDDYVPNWNTEQHTYEHGNTTSFMDSLTEQMGVEDLTDNERKIMQYLIGSLDDDGLLRKELVTICDELMVYESVFVSEEEVEAVLMRLQEFDPAGIGARSLQECLLIQVERMKATPLTMLLYRVINECFDEVRMNHWDKISTKLNLNQQQTDDLRYEMRHRLNPKPGAGFNEVQGRSLSQITPDVILNIDYDNNISFELNHGRVPELHVVKEDEEMLKALTEGSTAKSGKTDGAVTFLQHNITNASNFIDALRQRNDTIQRVMKAIIRLQRKYFLSGDDSDLKPMVLHDVAVATGLDISTISRVSRAKYIQTPWGTYPIRHLFSEGYTTKDGDTMSTKEIKQALQDVISKEDGKHPLSDDKLVKVMTERGYPIARRTITKYREQLGIPVARLRKQ